MKITIDTREDSHEEITKVINLLTALLDGSGNTNALSDEPKPIVGEGIFGMFSSNREEEAPSSSTETSAVTEVEGMLNENEERGVHTPEPKAAAGVKKEDDEPRIVPY